MNALKQVMKTLAPLTIALVLLVPFISSADWYHNFHDPSHLRQAWLPGDLLPTANTGIGTAWQHNFTSSLKDVQLRLADVDNDNVPEVLAISQKRLWSYKLGAAAAKRAPTVGAKNIVGVYDLDGDNTSEIITAGKYIEVFSGKDLSRTWSYPLPLASDSQLLQTRTFQNKGDKGFTLAFRPEGATQLLIKTFGEGGAANSLTTVNSAYGKTLLASDFDNDGSFEFMWPNGRDIYLRSSTTSDENIAKASKVLPQSFQPAQMAVDVDGDGDKELFTYDTNATQIVGLGVFNPTEAKDMTKPEQVRLWGCYFNIKAGAPTYPEVFPKNNGNRRDFVGDFDQDGQLEVATAWKGKGTTSGFFTNDELAKLGLGTGCAGNAQTPCCPNADEMYSAIKDNEWTTFIVDLVTGSLEHTMAGHRPMGGVDTDGDGHTDLLVYDDSTKTSKVLTWTPNNNDEGTYTLSSPLTSTTGPASVQTFPRPNDSMQDGHRPSYAYVLRDVPDSNGAKDNKQEILRISGDLVMWSKIVNGQWEDVLTQNLSDFDCPHTLQSHWTSADLSTFFLLFANNSTVCVVNGDTLQLAPNGKLNNVIGQKNTAGLAANVDGDDSIEELIIGGRLYDIDPQNPKTVLSERYQIKDGDPWQVADLKTASVVSSDPIFLRITSGTPDTAYAYDAKTTPPKLLWSYSVTDHKMKALIPGHFFSTNETSYIVALDSIQDSSKALIRTLKWDGKSPNPTVVTEFPIQRTPHPTKGHYASFQRNTTPYTRIFVDKLGTPGKLFDPNDTLDDVFYLWSQAENSHNTNRIYIRQGLDMAPIIPDQDFRLPNSNIVSTYYASVSALIDLNGNGVKEFFWRQVTSILSTPYSMNAFELGTGSESLTPKEPENNSCGDGVCDNYYKGYETPSSCAKDCKCGDNQCSASEDSTSCPKDCVATVWPMETLWKNPHSNRYVWTYVDVGNDKSNEVIYSDSYSAIFVRSGKDGSILPGYPLYVHGGQLFQQDTPPQLMTNVNGIFSMDVDGDTLRDDIVVYTDEGYVYAIELTKAGPQLLWSRTLHTPITSVLPVRWDKNKATQQLVAYGLNGTAYGLGTTSNNVEISDVKTDGISVIKCTKEATVQLTNSQVVISGAQQGFDKVVIKVNNVVEAEATVNGQLFTATINVPSGLTAIEAVAQTNTACKTNADCPVSNLCTQGFCESTVATNVMVNLAADHDGDGVANAADCPEQCGHMDKTVSKGATEICDGVDNNCNGKIDDGPEANASCEDTKECTLNTCVQGQCEFTIDLTFCVIDGQCIKGGTSKPGNQCLACLPGGKPGQSHISWVPNTGAQCTDGNACTENDACSDKGQCQSGKALNCDDKNVCTTDSCDTKSGCVNKDNLVACTDDDACTLNDQCKDGSCQSGAKAVCEDNNPCTTDTCKKESGCDNAPNTLVCNDNNACTTQDVCKDKACVGGKAPNCNDDEFCTDDSCDEKTGCVNTPNQLKCNDSNECTTDDVCKKGTCTGTAPESCNDNNPCTNDSCNKDTGCEFPPNTIGCDDGNECTTKDTCQNAKCAGGKALECNDNNPCTADSCDPAKGCQFVANTAPCTDNNKCTTGDVCQDTACAPGKAPDCNDNNPCTDDTCDPQLGCVNTPNTAACSDDNACTAGDQCQDGICQSGSAVACDDDNACTTDSCDKATGCINANNTETCDDNNACTTEDTCTEGKCVGGKAPDCNDNNPCTDDACDDTLGCTSTNNELACDDGNACTTVDVCTAGLCVGSEAPNCDDNNGCTTDSCDATAGCLNLANTEACDDNNACTTQDTCNAGQCMGGAPPQCDDNNPCTDDTCDNATGCVNANNTAQCDDANACTTDDLCTDGACVGGKAPECNDNNPCTDDTCDATTGCAYANNTAQCDDNNACTQSDVCAEGACAGVAIQCAECQTCDAAGECVTNDDQCFIDDQCVAKDETPEGNPCKVCDPLNDSGKWSALSGPTCDDGNACTQNDMCTDGTCAGTAVQQACESDDACQKAANNPCVTSTCDSTSCTCIDDPTPHEGQSCDDGDVCTEQGVCKEGQCVIQPISCDDDNPCTTDKCTDSGCVNEPNTNPCDDNNACTENDACQAGACAGTAISCDDGGDCINGECQTVQCQSCDDDPDCGSNARCMESSNGPVCMVLCNTESDCSNGEKCNASQDGTMRCESTQCSPKDEEPDVNGAEVETSSDSSKDSGCQHSSSQSSPVKVALLVLLLSLIWIVRRRPKRVMGQ